MARMNISVPDDVKARMDAVEEPVNWSAIASRAFEIELGEVAKRKEEKDMSAVIDRLRASKLVNEEQDYKDGHARGKLWAENNADYGELDRLAAWSLDENWIDMLYDPSENDWPAAVRLYLAATGSDRDYDRSQCSEFWDSAAGSENVESLTCGFVHGFSEGALETFDRVRDEI